MGVLLSKTKTDSSDFEKILNELDDKIQKAEIKITKIKIQQKRMNFMWTIGMLVVWVTCIVYFFKKINDIYITAYEYMQIILPIILFPFGLYGLRKAITHFYEKKQKKEEYNLTIFRKDQKDKVEELKKKTSYYSTHSLIERYDDEAIAKKKKENELRLIKPIPNQTQNLHQIIQHKQPQQQLNKQIVNNLQHQQQLQQQKMVPYTRYEPQWYDKLVDALVGDAGPETKYALICTHCSAHNGLVLQEEYETIQYLCPVCKQFNPSRQSKQEIPNTILKEKSKEKVEK